MSKEILSKTCTDMLQYLAEEETIKVEEVNGNTRKALDNRGLVKLTVRNTGNGSVSSYPVLALSDAGQRVLDGTHAEYALFGYEEVVDECASLREENQRLRDAFERVRTECHETEEKYQTLRERYDEKVNKLTQANAALVQANQRIAELAQQTSDCIHRDLLEWLMQHSPDVRELYEIEVKRQEIAQRFNARNEVNRAED